jgi:predicted restriction endonuclease
LNNTVDSWNPDIFKRLARLIEQHGEQSQRGWSNYHVPDHAWNDLANVLELIPEAKQRGQTSSAIAELENAAALLEDEGYFSPYDLADERRRTMRAIVQRRGQPEFRAKLIAAYNGRCAVTGCDALEALEAAHIVPYCGKESQHISNGLLLRADIHTLFDLDLIGIVPDNSEVAIASGLLASSYSDLKGKKLAIPGNSAHRPHKDALAQRWKRFSAK